MSDYGTRHSCQPCSGYHCLRHRHGLVEIQPVVRLPYHADREDDDLSHALVENVNRSEGQPSVAHPDEITRLILEAPDSKASGGSPCVYWTSHRLRGAR